jgi:hypothetical protein
MKTPEIIIIILWSISLMYNSSLHGKERTGKHNIFSTLFAFGIMLSLFIWAGLFSNN